jgi:hypothetical protein
VNGFTARPPPRPDPPPCSGSERTREGVVRKLEAWVEALFAWGMLAWATAVLYGLFLIG